MIISGPPAPPPTAMIGNPVEPSSKMVGVFEDCGRFPGLIKLVGRTGLGKPGAEKSPMQLFKKIPVLAETFREANLQKFVFLTNKYNLKILRNK